jgi:hypothetical protein
VKSTLSSSILGIAVQPAVVIFTELKSTTGVVENEGKTAPAESLSFVKTPLAGN